MMSQRLAQNNASWLLDHPLEPVLGPATGRTRGRMMTVERVLGDNHGAFP
jgi:hypothetical protein